MKRLLASAVILAFFLGTSVTQASRQPHSRPTLKLVRANPTVVAGRSFRAREAVRVTFSAQGKQKSRSLHASAQGSFLVTFDAPIVDHCSAARVVAVGDSGSRASLKPLPLPGCLPAQHP